MPGILGIVSALAVLGLSCAPAMTEERVVVVTSYHDELTSRFEEAFERAYPNFRVQIIWKQGRDALAALSKPDRSGVDVYWGPSLENFPVLRDAGAFQSLQVDRSVLPGRIGAQTISDSKGAFEAFEVAGYGLAVNAERLNRRNLAVPKTWRDLASPAYAGQIVMPVPGRVGFATSLYDIILQSEGWEAGWALISEVAANSELVTTGVLPTASVHQGEASIGLTIDFQSLSAAANGQPVTTIYPERTAFLPAYIAIMDKAPHTEAAKAFVNFALSREGQSILLHPDIRRHPVRPDAYAGVEANYTSPFKIGGASFSYDGERGRTRRELVISLFELMIAERQGDNGILWRMLQKAEADLTAASDDRVRTQLARARRLIGSVPVTEADANNGKFGPEKSEERTKNLSAWRQAFTASWAEAKEILAAVQASKK